MDPIDFRIGDLLRLRRPHPCGGLEWRVYRLGADIGITCTTCGRYVLISRRTLEKRVKRVLERGVETPLPGQGLSALS
jgi:hypothetical protein